MPPLSALLTAAVDLALPRYCLGCHRPGPAICGGCRASVGPARPFVPDPRPGGFPPAWVAGEYAGVLRSGVLAAKERGRADLLPLLAGALAGAVTRAVPGSGPVLLVPVPSSPRAARRRGGDHMLALSRRTAVELTRAGRAAAVLPALRLLRTPRDSAGLTAAERAVNLDGAFAVAPGMARLAAGLQIVLVDDVVTTGTTLSQAARVLREAGVPTSAAAVAGTARRRGR